MILGQSFSSRVLSLLISLSILILFAVYSVGFLLDQPWDLEELKNDPRSHEGQKIVFTHEIKEIQRGEIISLTFSRNKERISVPLAFPDQPEMSVGDTISVKGISRLASEGVISVENYHVASTGPKFLLGLLGLVIMAAYFLSKYRFIPRLLMWEEKADA